MFEMFSKAVIYLVQYWVNYSIVIRNGVISSFSSYFRRVCYVRMFDSMHADARDTTSK